MEDVMEDEDTYRDMLTGGQDFLSCGYSSDQIDEEEVEALLYSQLHFDQVPDIFSEDNNPGSQYPVIQEQLPETDKSDVQSKEHISGVLSTPAYPKVDVLKQQKPRSNKKQINKKTTSLKPTGLSKFLKRSCEPETTKLAKRSTKKTSSKSLKSSVVVVSSDSDIENEDNHIHDEFIVIDSVSSCDEKIRITVSRDHNTRQEGKRKLVSGHSDSKNDGNNIRDEFVVIDSISSCDENSRIPLSYDHDAQREGKRKLESDYIFISESESEWQGSSGDGSDRVLYLSSSDLDSSFDSGGSCELMKDEMVLNVSKARSSLVLDCAELEDYEHLSLDDVHKAIGECDWSLIAQDQYIPVQSAPSRYFRPLNIQCHNCNERGHLSKVCPKPKKMCVCFLCGLEGHISSRCPHPMCRNCLTFSHGRRSCREDRRAAPYNQKCIRCGMQGHLQQNCPDWWRQYHITTKPGPLQKPTGKEKTHINKNKSCYVCGKRGHFGYECRLSSMHGVRRRPSPFVSCYSLALDHTEMATQKGFSPKLQSDQPYTKSKTRIRDRKNPKRKLTQSERLEAEYTGRPARSQSSNSTHRNQEWKGRNQKAVKQEAKHSGDFPRHPVTGDKGFRRFESRQTRRNKASPSNTKAVPFSRKRKSDDLFDLKRKVKCYSPENPTAGTRRGNHAGEKRKKKNKKSFTSARGFTGSK